MYLVRTDDRNNIFIELREHPSKGATAVREIKATDVGKIVLVTTIRPDGTRVNWYHKIVGPEQSRVLIQYSEDANGPRFFLYGGNEDWLGGDAAKAAMEEWLEYWSKYLIALDETAATSASP